MSWRDFGLCGCGCVTTSVSTVAANDVTKEAGLFMMRPGGLAVYAKTGMVLFQSTT